MAAPTHASASAHGDERQRAQAGSLHGGRAATHDDRRDRCWIPKRVRDRIARGAGAILRPVAHRPKKNGGTLARPQRVRLRSTTGRPGRAGGLRGEPCTTTMPPFPQRAKRNRQKAPRLAGAGKVGARTLCQLFGFVGAAGRLGRGIGRARRGDARWRKGAEWLANLDDGQDRGRNPGRRGEGQGTQDATWRMW